MKLINITLIISCAITSAYIKADNTLPNKKNTLQSSTVLSKSVLIKNSGIRAYSPETCDLNRVNIDRNKVASIIKEYNIYAENGQYLFNFDVCSVFENQTEIVNIYRILWNKRGYRVFYYLLLSNKDPYHAMVTVNEDERAFFISKYQRDYSQQALKEIVWKKMLDMTIDNENYY